MDHPARDLQASTHLSTDQLPKGAAPKGMTRQARRSLKSTGVVVCAALAVGACSWVPDWANPFGSDADRPIATLQAEQSQEPAETAVSTVEETARPVVEGLVADGNREYSETLRPEAVETQSAFAAPQTPETTAIAAAPATPQITPQPAPTQPAPQQTAQFAPAPAPTPAPTDQSELFQATFNSGSFNQMPPVLANQGSQTVVISGAGVRRVGGTPAQFNVTPVSTMPGFSPEVNSLTNGVTPITISSRGVSSSSGQGQFVPASTTNAPQRLATGGTDNRAALVYFDTGSTQIDRQSRQALQAFADLYRQQGGIVRVVGHASQRTRDMSFEDHIRVNFNVSLGRAQRVGQALTEMGVPADAIILEAKGSSEPEFLEIMPSGEARNRRVELFLDQNS